MNDKGFTYLTALSFSAIDRSDLPDGEKRDLLYSTYAFAALYEEDVILNPDKILFKREICFKREWGEDNVPYDCVLVEEDGKKFLRYDAAGETYFRLNGGDAPKKLDLYEMAYKIVTLNTATEELKVMWYIYFPFIPMLEGPMNKEYYAKLKKAVLDESLYPAVLNSRYSDIIYDSAKEMVLGGVDPIITDWYIEFVEWKNVKTPKGVTREVEKYQKFLAKGDFEYVLKGTEKLLNTFPTDEEIILLNIASRVSLGNRDKKLLTDALVIIDAALARRLKKPEYFSYYKGLCKLGLNEIEEAKDIFSDLDKNHNFELAKFMLSALNKYRGEKI